MWLFVLYKTGELLSCYLPSSVALWVAKRIADLFFYLPFKRYKFYKKAVLHNLNLTLHFAGSDRKEYARRVFQNFAQYIREFFWLRGISKNRFFREVTPVGVENLDAALRLGNGVFLLSAHIGNWEWGGIGLALNGYNIHFLVRPHKNPYINRLFLSLRERHGIKVIPLPYVRQVIKALQTNSVVATLVDEAEKGVEVKMFGKKIHLASGPFEIAYRFKSVILPAFMVKDRKSGKQKGVVEPPIFLNYNVDAKRSIHLAAQEFARVMEDYLRFYPEHWLLLKKKNFT
ncbi:lysophospholipid acyltransferase family protein [Candidatus Aerophobetes bacterium]|nr:lysophospholipid acyltransferase family protein [Candidatus Aerophobetes bacterium]